jgi:serine/threonine protein kinase
MHPLADTGRVIAGRYRLQAPIGRGAMGVVWRAHDQLLDREVAIKEVVLPPGLTPAERDVLYERTFREARASARLNHPGVVTVHDVVEAGGRPWIVMELVRARSLQDMIEQEGSLPHRRVAEIGLQTLAALRHAHEKGILHRDVKPSNVLITDSGRVVLTDFGIAQAEGDSTLTQTGLVMGSPAYIPPERARGERAVPASDLWSLGATLYAAVEGRSPYERSDAMSSLAAALSEPVHRMTGAQAMPLLTKVAATPPPPPRRPAPDHGPASGVHPMGHVASQRPARPSPSPPQGSGGSVSSWPSAEETVLDETVLDDPSGRYRSAVPQDDRSAEETVLDSTDFEITRRDPGTGASASRDSGYSSGPPASSSGPQAGQRPGVDPEARTLLEGGWAGSQPNTPPPWEPPGRRYPQWEQPDTGGGRDRERTRTILIVTVAVVLVVAGLSPQHTWEQPILRLFDTAVGIAVGLGFAWTAFGLTPSTEAGSAPSDG